MDISFDIIDGKKGDQLRIALSYYDSEILSHFSSDLLTLTLVFYDVTLVRESGKGYVGYKMLYAVSETLAKFMNENEDAILCFYCDAMTDLKRNHAAISPQEYRSRLFSRMFDKFTKDHQINKYTNHSVRIEVDDNPLNSQFAHFICRKEHESAVEKIETILKDIDK